MSEKTTLVDTVVNGVLVRETVTTVFDDDHMMEYRPDDHTGGSTAVSWAPVIVSVTGATGPKPFKQPGVKVTKAAADANRAKVVAANKAAYELAMAKVNKGQAKK